LAAAAAAALQAATARIFRHILLRRLRSGRVVWASERCGSSCPGRNEEAAFPRTGDRQGLYFCQPSAAASFCCCWPQGSYSSPGGCWRTALDLCGRRQSGLGSAHVLGEWRRARSVASRIKSSRESRSSNENSPSKFSPTAGSVNLGGTLPPPRRKVTRNRALSSQAIRTHPVPDNPDCHLP
jgi:hypothetical protein